MYKAWFLQTQQTMSFYWSVIDHEVHSELIDIFNYM